MCSRTTEAVKTTVAIFGTEKFYTEKYKVGKTVIITVTMARLVVEKTWKGGKLFIWWIFVECTTLIKIDGQMCTLTGCLRVQFWCDSMG